MDDKDICNLYNFRYSAYDLRYKAMKDLSDWFANQFDRQLEEALKQYERTDTKNDI